MGPYCCQSTSRGSAGVHTIQLWGRNATELARAFLKTRHGASRWPDANHPRLCRWFIGDIAIDQVVVNWRPCPTNEAVVHIHTHGSQHVVGQIVAALRSTGVEELSCAPQDVTWGPSDLITSDLIAAVTRCRTPAVARWITRCTTELRSALNEISALIAEAPHQAQGRLQVLLNTVETGRRLIEGSRIVLSGPPNAGKSTLANRLFERPWSTESHVPGTTRDWVDQPIAIDGVPIELIDTAGIREAGDALEHAAIERSRAQVTAADVVIWVIDGAEQHAAATFVPASHALRADIVVINKTDLINDASRVDAVRQGVSSCNSLPLTSIIALSAKSGVGIDILRCAVTSAVLQGSGWPAPGMWPGILYEELQQAATLLPRDPTAAHRLIGRCSEP